MRIAVYGSGGLGGYYGARLAQAGHEVGFIARGAHLEAIRANGLKVLSPLGDVHLAPPLATDTSADIGPVDAVIVAVKTWQVTEAARALVELAMDEGIAVGRKLGHDIGDGFKTELMGF